MTREEYLNALKMAIKDMPQNDIEEIMRDFEEHFDVGISENKTEHEISAELGDPNDVAKTYLDPNFSSNKDDKNNKMNTNKEEKDQKDNSINQSSEKDVSGTRVFVVLFNVFIMIWIFISLLSVIVSLWGIPFGLLIATIILYVLCIPATSAAAFVFIIIGIGLFFFAVLTVVINIFITRGFILLSKEYIKWNQKLWNKGF